MKTQEQIVALDAAALAAGDPAPTARLVQEIAPTVWATISLLSAGEEEAHAAFLEIMAKLRAGHFALVRQYSGRGTFATFLALTVRDLLAQRILQLLQADGEKGWRGFEALFGADLQRLIMKRLSGAEHEETRKEAYQSIGLALIESDYRRLKAYNGSGSFAGFVFKSADRLLVDFIRTFAARRRAKDGARPIRVEIDLAAIADSTENSPESRLEQDEEDGRLAAALAVLARAVETLPEAERCYLAIALGGAEMRPSRDIAALMQRPVEDIYKLKQRVLKRLRDEIAEEPAVKNWRASV